VQLGMSALGQERTLAGYSIVFFQQGGCPARTALPTGISLGFFGKHHVRR
jgi:hypothetical protein